VGYDRLPSHELCVVGDSRVNWLNVSLQFAAYWLLYLPQVLTLKKFFFLPTQYIYVFCTDLRTNSDYFPIQLQLNAFHNRNGGCLLRGADWVFEYNVG